MADRITIRDDELLFLKGPHEVDPIALGKAVSPLGFEAYTSTKSEVVEDQIKKLLVENGVSYVWQLVHLYETVLPATATINIPPLIAVLQQMVGKLEPTENLVVVDRFLLPNNPPTDYVDNLLSILESAIKRAQQVIFVTAPRCNTDLFQDIAEAINSRNANCQATHRTSEVFHDRFWIADRSKGLFVGTSLNGIGRRYALVDYMREDDVKQIVDALESEQLL